MINYDYLGDNELFNIVHHGSNLEDYVVKANFDLDNGEIEIFYLDNTDIKPQNSLYIQEFDKEGIVTKAYILNHLDVLDKTDKFIKYKIGYIKTYYDFDDDLDFYDLGND